MDLPISSILILFGMRKTNHINLKHIFLKNYSPIKANGTTTIIMTGVSLIFFWYIFHFNVVKNH